MAQHPEPTAHEEKVQELLQTALRDPDARRALIADPRGELERALGTTLPDDAEVTVIEEKPNQFHLILPAEPSGELSDEEMSAAAGGVLSSVRYPRYRSPYMTDVIIHLPDED